MEIDRETAIQTFLFDSFNQTYSGPAFQRAAVALFCAKIQRDFYGPQPAAKLIESVNLALKAYDRKMALDSRDELELGTSKEGGRKDLESILEIILEYSRLKLKAGAGPVEWETDLLKVIKGLVELRFENNTAEYARWEAQARDSIRRYYTGLVRQEGGLRSLFLEARRRALAEPEWAEALHEIFWQFPDRFDARDLPSVIDNPRRKRPVRKPIKDAIQPDGRIIMSTDDMIALVMKDTDGLRQISSALLRDELMAADAKQQDFIAWMQRELDGLGNPDRAQMGASAEAAVARTLEPLEIAESTIYVVSTFVGLVDQKLGHQIGAVGGAAIDITRQVMSFVDAAPKMGQLATALGSAVLTANVLSAAIAVISMFGPQEPTPEQIILQEIGHLRDQVRDLKVQMNARFDRIDRALVKIYDALDTHFGLVERDLATLRRQSTQIQIEIARLNGTLERLAADTRLWVEEARRTDLRVAINQAVDYDVTRRDPMPFSDYDDFENLFHSWATIIAFDPLETGASSVPDYAPAAVAGQLQGPLWGNLSYLDGWAVRQGLPSFAGDRPGNPFTWAAASSAYAKIIRDWPGNAKLISPTRLQEVIETAFARRSAREELQAPRPLRASSPRAQAQRHRLLPRYSIAVRRPNRSPARSISRCCPKQLIADAGSQFPEVREELARRSMQPEDVPIKDW
jgi:hypothetical protein